MLLNLYDDNLLNDVSYWLNPQQLAIDVPCRAARAHGGRSRMIPSVTACIAGQGRTNTASSRCIPPASPAPENPLPADAYTSGRRRPI